MAKKKRPDPVTSDQIAFSVNTNPVVIRRMLSLLQKGKLVKSRRGANAGWTLARHPDAITLFDVYKAVENESLFYLHHSPPNQKCPVGRGIQPVLQKIYGSFEDQLKRHLAKTTIEQVLTDTIS